MSRDLDYEITLRRLQEKMRREDERLRQETWRANELVRQVAHHLARTRLK